MAIWGGCRRYDEPFPIGFMGRPADHLRDGFAAGTDFLSPVHAQNPLLRYLKALPNSTLPKIENELKRRFDGDECSWHRLFDGDPVVAVVGQSFSHRHFWRQRGVDNRDAWRIPSAAVSLASFSGEQIVLNRIRRCADRKSTRLNS